MNDAQALARAEELAARGRGDVEPNPMVGAVLLQGGACVGEGWHRAFGGAHAEVEVLRAAGERARGATLCVTLEPCSTTSKTGPCTRAVVEAGVARVVVGSVDPAPDHAGRGLRELERAGVSVELVGSAGSAELIAPFARALGAPWPHVLGKWAMSKEGAAAPADRTRVQLSGPAAQRRVHAWRASSDAVLVGVGTVLADDPRLTPRGETPILRPLRRVVLDPSLRTPLGVGLVSTADETPTWVLCTEDADQERALALEDHGVRVFRLRAGPDWLEDGLRTCRLHGVRRLLVEGGPNTMSRLWRAGRLDQLAVFLTQAELGPGAVPAIEGLDLGHRDAAEVADRLRLQDHRVERLGSDLLLRGTCGPQDLDPGPSA